jgi:hypothetical protein
MSKAKIIDLFGDAHHAKSEAPPDASNDETVNAAPPEYLQSSKEKFARLKPYFEIVLTQLASPLRNTLCLTTYIINLLKRSVLEIAVTSILLNSCLSLANCNHLLPERAESNGALLRKISFVHSSGNLEPSTIRPLSTL